ncbi:MAG: proton-conducting transporter membrane subunit [Microthrixaceae bacterium]
MPGSLVGVVLTASREGVPLLTDPLAPLLMLAVAAAATPVLVRAIGARAFHLAALAPLAVLVWAAANWSAVVDGHGPSGSVEWVPALGLTLGLRLDGLSVLMVGLVAGVGAMVLTYAGSYFDQDDHDDQDDRALGRFGMTMLLFAAAMVGLVMAEDLFSLFLFWELTSVASYLLIGTDDRRSAARSGARQALLITGMGGLAMLGGFIVLGQESGTWSAGSPAQRSPVRACGRRGAPVGAGRGVDQVRPGAVPLMATQGDGRTDPGQRLLALGDDGDRRGLPDRPVLAGRSRSRSYGVRPSSVPVGPRCSSAATGPCVSTTSRPLLAYGTVSQLGLMTLLFGVGTTAAAAAGCLLLLAHGVFKAALFMVVGIVDHQTHTRDIRHLEGLGRRWPLLCATVALAAAVHGRHPTADRLRGQGIGADRHRRGACRLGALAAGRGGGGRRRSPSPTAHDSSGGRSDRSRVPSAPKRSSTVPRLRRSGSPHQPWRSLLWGS